MRLWTILTLASIAAGCGQAMLTPVSAPLTTSASRESVEASHRVSGVLLHPTSLPGRYGIGDLGNAAYEFIDFLVDAGQSLWQILPLGPTEHGGPYGAYSAFAGNPLLISLDKLAADGLLTAEELAAYPEIPGDGVNFRAVEKAKMPLLRKAFERFAEGKQNLTRLADFREDNQDWLPDFALFTALFEHHRAGWADWPRDLASREPAALAKARQEHARSILFHEFVQYTFFSQWQALRQYANRNGVQIIGDIPIYVSHHSSDVWANPQFFRLDPATHQSTHVAGVPPDAFSATGQRWGMPLYNWDALGHADFSWWKARFRTTFKLVDIVRVDHFRGFEAYWEIPADKPATEGRWVKAPGHQLFASIRRELGDLPFIAEDLGIITPEVEELRDAYDFAGTKVLQFAFGGEDANPYLPENYNSPNSIVYTGTHDNNTTVGWFQSLDGQLQSEVLRYASWKWLKRLPADERARVERALATAGQSLEVTPDTIHWGLIRVALASDAERAIFPLQDVLGLDGSARMNVPGTSEGNWAWRYKGGDLRSDAAATMKGLVAIFGRD